MALGYHFLHHQLVRAPFVSCISWYRRVSEDISIFLAFGNNLLYKSNAKYVL